MYFSVGLFYSTHAFLQFINKTNLTKDEFLLSFPTFEVASGYLILNTAIAGHWISISNKKKIVLTNRGTTLALVPSPTNALSLQLKDLILALRPSWSYVLQLGRKESAAYLPIDVRQIFAEAGLLSGISPEIVEWWDSVSVVTSKEADRQTILIGRKGERLSFEHEWRRTGTKPFWQAFESDLAGYDLLSQVSGRDCNSLRVEVKATDDNLDYAKFHVTRNEWRVATTSAPYVFHFWLLHSKPKLFKASPNKLAPHISSNRGAGEWEIVEIPWSSILD